MKADHKAAFEQCKFDEISYGADKMPNLCAAYLELVAQIAYGSRANKTRRHYTPTICNVVQIHGHVT